MNTIYTHTHTHALQQITRSLSLSSLLFFCLILFLPFSVIAQPLPQISVSFGNRTNCTMKIKMETCDQALYIFNLPPNSTQYFVLNDDYPKHIYQGFVGGSPLAGEVYINDPCVPGAQYISLQYPGSCWAGQTLDFYTYYIPQPPFDAQFALYQY